MIFKQVAGLSLKKFLPKPNWIHTIEHLQDFLVMGKVHLGSRSATGREGMVYAYLSRAIRTSGFYPKRRHAPHCFVFSLVGRIVRRIGQKRDCGA
jgi:hypothetical protein